GKNLVEISVTASEPETLGPQSVSKTVVAGLAGLLKITDNDGKITRLPINAAWSGRLAKTPTWQAAQPVGVLSDPKFGDILPGPLPQPAAFLRKRFDVSKPIKSARLYATALGSYRILINNDRVGREVLTPDFTDYTKRVLYQTYDVTGLLATGRN